MAEQYKYRFSVFTSTYNRAHLLRRVYKDLLSQTIKDFEWVIINDGSTDDTEKVANELILRGGVDIRYLSKPNGGKHTAHQAAAKLFRGRYVVEADDDDRWLPDTLETFDKEWRQLEASENYDDFWEVRARVSRDGKTIHGRRLPEPVFDSSYIDINYKYGFGTLEMHSCQKTSVLISVAAVPDTFIYSDKCSNFQESIRWVRAARKYKTRFVDKITRIYNSSPISLISSNRGQKRSSRKTYNSLIGGIYSLNEQRDLMLKYKPMSWVRTLINVDYWNILLGEDAISHLNDASDRIVARLLYLVSWMISIVRK